MKSFAALAALLPLSVHAATYTIRVGMSENTGKKGVGFDPSSVAAVQAGDIIDFIFLSGSHSAVQSTFESPCTPKEGGFDSGVQTVSDSMGENAAGLPSITLTMNDTSSLWFFDQSAGTCKKGAVFSVNPTLQESDASYKAAASTAATVAPTTTSTAAASLATASASSNGAEGVQLGLGKVMVIGALAALGGLLSL